MERASARLHDDGDEVELAAVGRRLARSREPVVGRVELGAGGGRLRPRVRAAHELDRPRVGLRLVQRYPARDHLRRDEVVRVRRVLVEPDRLRPRRLPEDVVLEDPHAAVAGELGGEAPRSLRKHLRGDDRVGLPRVAELPRAVLGIAPGHPVDLVRPNAGLVLALEESEVALAQPLECTLRDQTFFDDEESVAPEGLDLLGGELVDHRRRGHRRHVTGSSRRVSDR